MVSAWATANNLVLGQRKVDEKSNELTAPPELWRVLELNGCIITIDAMGCQKEIATEIIHQGGDYVLALKENHGQLYEDVKLLFDDLAESEFAAYAHDYTQTVNKGHGRIEIRQCWTISGPAVLRGLRGTAAREKLTTVVKVRGERQCGPETTLRTRPKITSGFEMCFPRGSYTFNRDWPSCFFKPTIYSVLCRIRHYIRHFGIPCKLDHD